MVLCLLLFIPWSSYAQQKQAITTLTPIAKSKYLSIQKVNRNVKIDNIFSFEWISIVAPSVLIDGKSVTSVTAETDFKNLVFESVGKTNVAKLRFFLRIASRDLKIIGFIEDTLSVSVDTEDATRRKYEPAGFVKFIDLPPGKYTAEIVLSDVTSGGRGIRTVKFEVPKPK